MTRLRALELIFGNTLGGAEVLLRELLRVFDRDRFEWHVATLRKKAPWEQFDALRGELGFELHHIPCGGGFDPKCLSALTRLMHELKFDVVHTHLVRADIHGRWAAHRARVPVVVTTIHVFRNAKMSWLVTPMERWSAKWADRVVGCTETVTRVTAERLRLPADRFCTIPNGTPLARFHGTQDASGLRNEFGIAPDAPVVGTIGRLNPEKNQIDFLRMAKRVADQIPKARFLLVGDGDIRPELEAQAAELGMADRVVFTGARNDIPAILSLMDCFVLCSKWEALPVTILEAMAAGTPCVCTAVGGCPDVVRPGETGWLVPPRDADALAKAVCGVLTDPTSTEKIVKDARQMVHERHDIAQTARAYENLFLELLESKGQMTSK